MRPCFSAARRLWQSFRHLWPGISGAERSADRVTRRSAPRRRRGQAGQRCRRTGGRPDTCPAVRRPLTSYGGTYLGDPTFEHLLDELELPGVPAASTRRRGALPRSAPERPDPHRGTARRGARLAAPPVTTTSPRRRTGSCCIAFMRYHRRYVDAASYVLPWPAGDARSPPGADGRARHRPPGAWPEPD